MEEYWLWVNRNTSYVYSFCVVFSDAYFGSWKWRVIDHIRGALLEFWVFGCKSNTLHTLSYGIGPFIPTLNIVLKIVIYLEFKIFNRVWLSQTDIYLGPQKLTMHNFTPAFMLSTTGEDKIYRVDYFELPPWIEYVDITNFDKQCIKIFFLQELKKY